MNVTVFTPTYNRAKNLPELFSSLLAQTCKSFEWLVIDDGSTDGTANLFDAFQKQADFPVRYYYKENGGKHTAYNLALELAQGDWFVCLDSDDLLTPNAVELLSSQRLLRPDLKGAMAYKQDRHGQYLGAILPDDLQELYLHDLGVKYHCGGDYVFAYETDLAQKYPFPVFPGEKFSPESLMLDALGQECPLAVLRETLMVCEYQPDGYSASARRLICRNPRAYCMYYLQKTDLVYTLKERIIAAGRYHCHRLRCHGEKPQYKGCHRLLVACCFPLGCLFRLYYKMFGGF